MATRKPTTKKKTTRTRKSSPAKLQVTQPRKAKTYPPMPEDTNRFFTEAHDGSAFVYVPIDQWAKMLQAQSSTTGFIASTGRIAADTPQIANKPATAGEPGKASLGYLTSMVYRLYHANDVLSYKLGRLKEIISRLNGNEVPPLTNIPTVDETKLSTSFDEQVQLYNKQLDELDTCLAILAELV